MECQGWACRAWLAVGVVLRIFFSIPQNVVLTGKPLDVAGPCVHAGPDPPVGRTWLRVVAAYRTRLPGPPVLAEAPCGEVCSPPARERAQGAQRPRLQLC